MKYMLRCRRDDNSDWCEPEEFPTRRARDMAGSFARIIGGLRTHSYEEKSVKPRAGTVQPQQETAAPSVADTAPK